MSMKLSNNPTANVEVEGPFYSQSSVYTEFLSSQGRGLPEGHTARDEALCC